MKDNELEQSHEERLVRQLRDLREGLGPPPRMAHSVVAALRDRGLIRGQSPWRRRWLASAAAAALFVGGFLVGRVLHETTPAPEAPTANYALFLLGGVEPTEDEAVRVEEYRRWAVKLAREGRLVGAEKLAPEAWLLNGPRGSELDTAPTAQEAVPLSGYFLLTIEDPLEALEIARSCPHLRHGGEVLLRPIEHT